MHTVDNLLCVARYLAGNYHASGKIYFKNQHCEKCESIQFCEKIKRLVKNESMEVASKND